MDAIHINWTKPFIIKTKSEYKAEDFEILTTILSALKWREKNGSIRMITDSTGAEYYKKNGLLEIWNGVETALDEVDADPSVFWAAGKIFALSRETAPIAMIDTDFIVWEKIDAPSHAAVIHFEDLYPDVYPSKDFFKVENYKFDEEFDWSLKAANTAFCIINDEELRKYYCKASIEFMRHTLPNTDYLAHMVFAEQRLLPMCAKKLNKTITAFSDLPALFGGSETRFTHTWGMKQQMRDDGELRTDFCLRCINRIVHEYPHMYGIMRNIENLKQYF